MTTAAEYTRTTPYTADEQDAITEAFNRVYDDIQATVYRFWEQYGGHLEDLSADANTIFLWAWNAYPTRGAGMPLERFVCRWVWAVLLDWRRSELTYLSRVGGNRLGRKADTLPSRTSDYDPSGLEDSLGPDACYVLRMVLDAPEDLAAAVDAKGGEGRNWRSSLRAHLRDLGWAADRINTTFNQLREAM